MKHSKRDFLTVGLVETAGAEAILSRLELRLTGSERYRAASFRRLEDQARYVLGRVLLMRLLADELGYRPAVLDLALTAQGRPYLASLPEVSFSISHAGSWVAVALAVGVRVGIDIESMDRRVELDPLAERIFNRLDLARFRSLPKIDQPRAFFRAWTGKEAVLKAKGIGLSGGVQEISAPLDDEPAELKDPAETATVWRIEPLAVSVGYAASLASDRADLPAVLRFLALADLG